MRQLGRSQERVAAALGSLILLLFIGFELDSIANNGLAFLGDLSIDPGGGLIGQASIIFLLVTPNSGNLILQSVFMRVQMQCLAVWLFLLGCMFTVRSWWFAPKALSVFVVAISVLGVYSLIALVWPLDLFSPRVGTKNSPS